MTLSKYIVADKIKKRRYDSPAREAGAANTRLAILGAAKRAFERRGWAGTTVAGVADNAGVSVKTVEAVFGTKAELLANVVDFAIRGDADPTPILGRASAAAVTAAPDAATMLDLHAAHVRAIAERSARVAWVVEQAAAGDARVARLWRKMNENRRIGVRWAAETLTSKPGYTPPVPAPGLEAIFWVALEWGIYRTLTEQAGLDADGYERWLREYYRALLRP